MLYGKPSVFGGRYDTPTTDLPRTYSVVPLTVEFLRNPAFTTPLVNRIWYDGPIPMKISPRPTMPRAAVLAVVNVNEHEGTNFDVSAGNDVGPDEVLGVVGVTVPPADIPALIPAKIPAGQPAVFAQPEFTEYWGVGVGVGEGAAASAPMTSPSASALASVGALPVPEHPTSDSTMTIAAALAIVNRRVPPTPSRVCTPDHRVCPQ